MTAAIALARGKPRHRASSSLPAAVAWHSQSREACLAELGSTATGLTEPEATSRRQRHGPNILPTSTRPTLIGLFFR